MRMPRPLESRYGVMLTIAILALAPFIIVTSAYVLFRNQVDADLHSGRSGLEVIAGMSTAGYAFGALLGGDLVQRFRQRWLFLICETLFIVGCVLSATAGGVTMYGSGRVLSGLATGLLLVIALPPVIQNFPADRLPITVVVVNIGFFGAICVGPLLGGVVAAGHAWRWFYGALAALGTIGLLLALVTLPDKEPPDPDLKFDPWVFPLGFAAVVLPFWASSELSGHGFASFRFTVPLSLGLACFVALLLTQYHQKEPLSPVKPMWTTLSVVGTLVAMVAGGVFVTFLELAEQFQIMVAHRSPLATGLLFWPLVLGVLITAVLLGVLLRTRFLPLLVLGGMMCLIAGGALVLGFGPDGSRAEALAAAGLLGLGAGATVSPGLYLAAFPLASKMIGRIFALIELVRSLADYILAPVILQVAQSGSGGKTLNAAGIHEATFITVLVTIALTVFGTILYLAGAPGLPRPDLEKWLGDGEPALASPALGALFRPRSGQ